MLGEEAVAVRDRCRYITNEERKRGTKAKIGAHEFDRSGMDDETLKANARREKATMMRKAMKGAKQSSRLLAGFG